MTIGALGAKPVIYELVVRLFGNTNATRKKDGTLAENGVGRFVDIDERALAGLRALGVTHVWLMGILRQATLTDYAAWGMPADPPAIVKGRAGSFYAIRDAYDVCPDYATEPSRRNEETDALFARIRHAGMVPMIDLVPNHVARSYGSVVFPERDFGRSDDTSRFFDPKNNHFYLVEPRELAAPGLTPSPHWKPANVSFTHDYAREDGSPGKPPKATGNNVTSPRPSPDDWYETIKLNYGFNFVSGEKAFNPIPETWRKVDAILAYWQTRGVGGFRTDFAHYIPVDAWRYLLSRVKGRDAASLVIAEAYEDLDALVDAGFDAVYAFEAYNIAKDLYRGARGIDDLAERLAIGDPRADRRVHYLENHDERRIASPIVHGVGTGDTGFGSARAVRQLGPVFYLASKGPILLFNGQEVGELGAGDEGFGGDDGRTTIFDYWAMPALQRWVHGHAYDGASLTPEEAALRRYYADLFALGRDPAVKDGKHANLRPWNRDALLPFLRFEPGHARALLVVANFAGEGATRANVHIPAALLEEAGFARDAPIACRLVLDERGHVDTELLSTTSSALIEEGLPVSVGDQAAIVVALTSNDQR